MHKKLVAALTIAIFVISTLVIMVPVQAHFTLGNYTATYRYHANDFDPHVSGVIGYVWPGGGQNAYNGFVNTASVNLSPGYQTPWPGGNPPGAPTMAWYQVEGHGYSPFGAVLTGSKGDLIFAMNSTSTTDSFGWQYWAVAVPPEFGMPDSSQVVTTLTNSYTGISVFKASPYDRYVPNWSVVIVQADGYSNHPFINFTSAAEWYYMRVNGVTAPSIAGKYFFKFWLGGASGLDNSGFNATQFIPTQNWPVMLVKGEVDPAILTGTIRYGGYNSTLYGQPIGEPGKVWAKMKTKLDPYTGAQLSGPLTDAVGYFNNTASGHYEVEGVAAGIYDIYAEAAGYPQALIASDVTVYKGQSLHFDGYLNPGVVIHGNVFTKHQFGDEPWPNTAYIKIELYDQPTGSNLPFDGDYSKINTHMVSWSPLPCVAGGEDKYQAGRWAGQCGDPRVASQVAFPWHEYLVHGSYMGTVDGLASSAYSGDLAVSGTTTTPSTALTTDPQGVGPAQNWFVAGGTTTPFHFEFGKKGMFGAPRDLDGHVPQVEATWVNGLTPGRYYVRAWTTRYVQTELDGATFHEYWFDVTPEEWAGDVTLPLDLRLSSYVNKTVHFHNLVGKLLTDSVNTGASTIYAGLATDPNLGLPLIGYGSFPRSDKIWAWNKTTITDPDNGHGWVGLYGINDTWGGQNYGIPSGTYYPLVFARGYLQPVQVGLPSDKISVTLSGNPLNISDHLYRGAGFNLTVFSIDWQRPRVDRTWIFPGQEIDILIFNDQLVAPITLPSNPYVPAGVVDHSFLDLISDEYSMNGPFGDVVHDAGYGFSLFQNHTVSHLEVNGGGVNVNAWDGANGVYFGMEAGGQGQGGRTKDRPDSFGHGDPTVAGIFNSGAAGFNRGGMSQDFRTPTAFPSGQYLFRGATYGYVQLGDVSVYAQAGQVADIRIQLLIGVNVSLDILFKKEHLITPTAQNMSARVRLFNDQGALVAEWMSSEGVYSNVTSGRAAAADGTREASVTGGLFVNGCGYYGILGASDYPTCGTPGGDGGNPRGNPSNYLPGGVTLLHVNMAGLPMTRTWAGPVGLWPGYYSDPVFSNGGWACSWELDCVDTAYYRNIGILGYPDYTGGWTAEVDFVNWYKNNTGSAGASTSPQYFPPPPGLLEGESYHYIPGSTAASGFGYTEQMALDGTTFSAIGAPGVGHSMAPNHLGPYAQQGVWSLQGAHLSGEASGVFEVDLRGYVAGQALGFSWANEFRTQSWAAVTIAPASGTGPSFNAYSFDGMYDFYANPGDYKLTIAMPGLTGQTLALTVSDGQSSTGYNFYLEQSQIPVPEFSGIAIVAFSALAASLYLLRRRRQ